MARVCFLDDVPHFHFTLITLPDFEAAYCYDEASSFRCFSFLKQTSYFLAHQEEFYTRLWRPKKIKENTTWNTLNKPIKLC